MSHIKKIVITTTAVFLSLGSAELVHAQQGAPPPDNLAPRTWFKITPAPRPDIYVTNVHFLLDEDGQPVYQQSGPDCENEIIEDGEQCENPDSPTPDLDGQSCSSLGLGAGTLGCSDSCRFDTSGCQAAPACDNGIIEAAEQCENPGDEDPDLSGQTCESLGFARGVLGCQTNTCQFDYSGCGFGRAIIESVTADPDSSDSPKGRVYSGMTFGGGKIWYYGGGHNGYAGNDVEFYNVFTNQWTQSYRPNACPTLEGTDPMVDCYSSYGGAPTDAVWTDPQDPTNLRPYTEHTYDFYRWDPSVQKLKVIAGYSFWEFDPITRLWTALAGQHTESPTLSYAPSATGASHMMGFDDNLQSVIKVATAATTGPTSPNGLNGSPGTFKWTGSELERLDDGNMPNFNGGILYSAYDTLRKVHYVKCLGCGFFVFDASKIALGQSAWQQGVNGPGCGSAGSVTDFDYDQANDLLVGLSYSQEGSISSHWQFDPKTNTCANPSSFTMPGGGFPRGGSGGGNSQHNPVFKYSPEKNLFYYLYSNMTGNDYNGAEDVELWAYRIAGSTPDPDPDPDTAPNPPTGLAVE